MLKTLALCALWSARPARAGVSTETIRSAVETLSSDEFEGRSPATEGEKKTLDYLVGRFKALGLAPGNPDGTYLQKVPLVGASVENTDAKLEFEEGGKKLELAYADDYVAITKRLESKVSMDAPLVFAGYGVQAPEYGWDDFKGLDVKGKVLVVLINNPESFAGKAMTYYGRWTYKYEKAAELGAAGCLIVHETIPAAYPWEVVRNSWGGEQFDLETPAAAKSVPVQGWITRERAVELFKLAGLDFDAAKAAAVHRDFKPIELGAKARLSLRMKHRRIVSANVAAKLMGSDPKLKDEWVAYMAHWDHLGAQGPGGKTIYHGAADNASGCGALLALGESFAKLPKAPRRSLLFLATTAEEQGLLGSKYYVSAPLVPLAKTAAVLNMDVMNTLGPTKDVVVIGFGQSELDDAVARAAAARGRVVAPDPEPEKGHFYRADHLSFAKAGVPALFLGEGVEVVGRPEGWGLKMLADYNENRYHKPTDVIRPDWDWQGMADDVDLLFEVGRGVADAETAPKWKPTSEFARLR